MNRSLLIAVIVISMGAGSLAMGQGTVAPPSGQKTLAATMNVYAFPTKGQTPEKQSEDEAACYTYAVQNTGSDPFQLQKQSQQQQQKSAQAQKEAQQAGQGAGAKGAVGGAAAGALIGAVAGDAGKGAAYGAAAGLIRGRRRGREAEAQASQEAKQQAQQAQQATQQQLDNFKKAFSVCLEAKNYMVKY